MRLIATLLVAIVASACAPFDRAVQQTTAPTSVGIATATPAASAIAAVRQAAAGSPPGNIAMATARAVTMPVADASSV